MVLFSQRAGIRPLSKAIQRESIHDELRNALWIAFHEAFVKAYSYERRMYHFPEYPYRKEVDRWRYSLWTEFYKKPSHTQPKFRDAINQIRTDFFRAEWHWVFDFLEFSAKHAKECGSGSERTRITTISLASCSDCERLLRSVTTIASR
jgi:hypothetical protein